MNRDEKNAYHRLWRNKNPLKEQQYRERRKKLYGSEIRNYQHNWYQENRDRLLKKNKRTHKLMCLNCMKAFMGFKAHQKYCSRVCMFNFLSTNNRYRHIGLTHKLLHRQVVEKFLGRELTKNEIVHHVDENKKNNLLSNLIVFDSNSSHVKWHRRLEVIRKNITKLNILRKHIVFRCSDTNPLSSIVL
mgnify:CR=1 FL=1